MKSLAKKICFSFMAMALLLCLLGSASHYFTPRAGGSTTPIKVVPSIKPIALILENLVENLESAVEISAPLIAPTASVHHTNASIKDFKLCHESALIVWIGPQLEEGLSKLFPRFGEKAVALGETAAVEQWLESTEAVKPCCHHLQKKSGSQRRLKALQRDWHLWYSPKGVELLTKELAQHLMRLLPEHRESIEQNLERFLTRLDAELQQARQLFSSAPLRRCGVTHNAYRHLFKSLNIPEALECVELARNGVSPLKWVEIAQTLEKESIELFFVEWSTPPLLAKLQMQRGFRVVVTDQTILEGPNAPKDYLNWFRQLLALLEKELILQEASRTS